LIGNAFFSDPDCGARLIYSTRYLLHKSSKLEQLRRISMAALNSKVRKAVIPVAGLGTRMLPATKAIPKEMLPLVDKPLIQYVVNECIAAGITEIVLVTHSSKTLSKTISIQVLNLKPCWKNVLSVSC
jgi:UTP--glucose-1-phosphate uridylyltransferase